MEFSYFTLSDNNYRDNPRTPNQFVADIAAEAIYAEELGMHAAWVGEHHFSTLGVNSCPEILLTHVAAKTKHIRLAPVAAGAAASMHGSLDAVARLYKEACAAQGTTPQRLITSYFIHFADTPAEEQHARERQLRYHKECTSPAFPGDPKTAPESYRYFEKIVQRYQTQKPEDFNSNSVLIGSPQQIVDTIASKVQAAGFDEVILYFNLGLKPHAQVKDEMARFMAEVAPTFEGKHKQRAA